MTDENPNCPPLGRVTMFCCHLRDALEAMPAGRERSLAITKLEECEMWATRAQQIADAALVEKLKNPTPPV